MTELSRIASTRDPNSWTTWSGVELRHLDALRAIAEEESFSRAAARLGYTQSAISQQIAALERAIEHQVLRRRRGRRTVTLTTAGRIVLEHADAIASELAATRAGLHALAEAEKHALTVGIPAANGAYWLPAVIAERGADFLGGRFRLIETADERRLAAAVRSGEVDVAFLPSELLPAGLEGIDLPPDPYTTVAHRTEGTALWRDRCVLADLAEHPLLLLRSALATQELERICKSRRIRFRCALRSDNPALLTSLAGTGLGIAVLPRLAVPPLLPTVHVGQVEDVPPRRLTIAWKAQRPEPSLRAFFVEAALNVFMSVLKRASPEAA
jgi:DNA-binding transcriptional LysR family regulator